MSGQYVWPVRSTCYRAQPVLCLMIAFLSRGCAAWHRLPSAIGLLWLRCGSLCLSGGGGCPGFVFAVLMPQCCVRCAWCSCHPCTPLAMFCVARFSWGSVCWGMHGHAECHALQAALPWGDPQAAVAECMLHAAVFRVVCMSTSSACCCTGLRDVGMHGTCLHVSWLRCWLYTSPLSTTLLKCTLSCCCQVFLQSQTLGCVSFDQAVSCL